MLQLKQTNSGNPDFQALVTELDKDLAIRDGDEHLFYAALNTTDTIKHAIVMYEDELPVGCGALREYEPGIMEVKRMYVLPGKRGQGIASVVLKGLEDWAKELGYKKCILETGKKQPEAISLYQKNYYRIIPNYGKYAGIDNSVCFEKKL
jgi:putative acetyltransferase